MRHTTRYAREAELYRLPYPRTRSVLALARPCVALRDDVGTWAYDCRSAALEGASHRYLARLLGLDDRAARRFEKDDLIDAVLAIEFGIE